MLDKKVLNIVEFTLKLYILQSLTAEITVGNMLCDFVSGTDDMYEEQVEDPENPLRCPIKLYDFYLFKW